MKLPFMVSIATFLGFNRPRRPVNADTNMEKCLRILIAHGCITVREIHKFTNDGTKLIFLMRKAGFIPPLGDPKGETRVLNASGNGYHKVYRWSGKMPVGWVKTDAYTGKERRTRVRGGCR